MKLLRLAALIAVMTALPAVAFAQSTDTTMTGVVGATGPGLSGRATGGVYWRHVPSVDVCQNIDSRYEEPKAIAIRKTRRLSHEKPNVM